jgi:long-chain acyl-CoA synthetase
LRHRISIGDVHGSEPIAALLKEPVMTLAFPAAEEEDVAAILYTSGTTGQPKGVVLCNINIVHSALHYTFAMKLSRGDRSIAVVPLSPITGYIAHVAAMTCCAGALILMPRFKASEFISLARREKMTHVVLVPAMYADLA